MPDAPFLHESSGTVRFWVTVDDRTVGASIRKETLRYHFRTGESADPLEIYGLHAEAIDAVVRRRIAQGAMEPVMLRDHDLLDASS